MLKYYRPTLRPASKATLPPGLVWDYAEIPHDTGFRFNRPDFFRFNRPDLKVSRFFYGVIKCKVLSKEECEHFDLCEVWPYNESFIETNPANFQHTESVLFSPNQVAMLLRILKNYLQEEAEASEEDALRSMIALLSERKQPE